MHAGIQLKADDRPSRVTVVPGCGSGQYRNLAGTMSIEISHGIHGYVFEYDLHAVQTARRG